MSSLWHKKQKKDDVAESRDKHFFLFCDLAFILLYKTNRVIGLVGFVRKCTTCAENYVIASSSSYNSN
jgi:hypothetical protein